MTSGVWAFEYRIYLNKVCIKASRENMSKEIIHSTSTIYGSAAYAN